MTLPSDLTFDAHIGPILAGDHAPGLRDEVLEIQSLLARIAFPRRSDPRAASLVASLQARLGSRLGGNLQRWKDLGDEEKLLYIVMGLGQANNRIRALGAWLQGDGRYRGYAPATLHDAAGRHVAGA